MIDYNTSRVKACRPTGDDFSGSPSSSSSSSSSSIRLSSCSSRAGFYNSEPTIVGLHARDCTSSQQSQTSHSHGTHLHRHTTGFVAFYCRRRRVSANFFPSEIYETQACQAASHRYLLYQFASQAYLPNRVSTTCHQHWGHAGLSFDGAKMKRVKVKVTGNENAKKTFLRTNTRKVDRLTSNQYRNDSSIHSTDIVKDISPAKTYNFSICLFLKIVFLLTAQKRMSLFNLHRDRKKTAPLNMSK